MMSYATGLFALLVTYFIIYGALLWGTGSFPYVMDNNESFSSLWHGTNLFNSGLSQSFGLTDEAYGFNPAAHPYVHTHQGNFPRLFAFLIYALGARSIGSQILVTTFTVGLAAIFFAYRFFSKIANPLFALVCGLVLISDYVLVGQWQVATYRVWHEFFVFSSLLCVHGFGERRRIWSLLTIINFACLFYYEVVFVAFVSLATALYAAVIFRRTPRNALLFWLLQAAGGAIGLGVLALQLALYMGWDNLLQDAFFTFVARNQYHDSPELLQHMRTFFESQNIVFWYNLVDAGKFQTLAYFVASLTYFEFEVHTPFFSNLSWILLLGVSAALIPQKFTTPAQQAGENSMGVPTFQMLLSKPVVGAFALAYVHLVQEYWRDDFGNLHLIETAIIALAIVCSAVLAELSRNRVNKLTPGPLEALGRIARTLALVILMTIVPSIAIHVSFEPWLFTRYSALFCIYILLFFAFLWWLLWGRGARPSVGRRVIDDRRVAALSSELTAVVAALFMYCALFGFFVVVLGKTEFLGIQGKQEWFVPASTGYMVLAAVAAAAAMFLVLKFFGRPAGAVLRRVLPRPDRVGNIAQLAVFVLVIALFLAGNGTLYNQLFSLLWLEILHAVLPGPLQYLAVILATGLASFFVVSGSKALDETGMTPVLRRIAVFLFTGFIAYIAVYLLSPGYIFTGYRVRYVPFTVFHTNVLVAATFYVLLVTGLRYLRMPSKSSGASVRGAALGLASFLLLGMMGVYWIGMQGIYLRLLPPDHYSFLKTLSKPPYRDASFVVDNYAAPVAAFTGQWAYFDPEISSGIIVLSSSGPSLHTDKRYLWLADRRVNADYEKPDYFLCMIPQTMSSVINVIMQRKGLESGHLGCSTRGIVKLAMQNDRVSPFQLMAIDTEGPREIGFDSWAIVKIDWDSLSHMDSTKISAVQAPQGLTARRVVDNRIIVIDWQSDFRVKAYEVEMQRGDGPFVKIGSVLYPKSRYIIQDVDPNSRYRFRNIGSSGLYSDVVEIPPVRQY